MINNRWQPKFCDTLERSEGTLRVLNIKITRRVTQNVIGKRENVCTDEELAGNGGDLRCSPGVPGSYDRG